MMLFNCLLLAVVAYAAWKGGQPERICAGLFFTCALLTIVAAPQWHWVSNGVDWGIFAVDLSLFVALMLLALHADRFWPLAVTGVHGLAVLGHVSIVIAPEISPLVYATITMGSSFPTLIILAVGTFRHQQRLAAHGVDSDWTDYSAINPARPATA